MFYRMSNLKSAVARMPKDIERNDKERLYFIHQTICELIQYLDEEKKVKKVAKRENALPIVEEIDKVLQKYRVREKSSRKD